MNTTEPRETLCRCLEIEDLEPGMSFNVQVEIRCTVQGKRNEFSVRFQGKTHIQKVIRSNRSRGGMTWRDTSKLAPRD